MEICPLCNGLQQTILPCKRCSSILIDKGKLTDYLDDYSAYEDIDLLKKVDGLPNQTLSCVYCFYCENCSWEEQMIISFV